MKRFSFAVVLSFAMAAWFTGCPTNTFDTNLPPSDQFYFPSGIAHIDSPMSPDGILFVSNGNFDKRYAAGSVMAVNLSRVGLPPFGQAVAASGPVQLPKIGVGDAGIVLISSFAGEMATLDLGQGRTRLFIPSRSEGMKFHAIDAEPLTEAGGQPVLHCSTPEGNSSADCATNALSLSPKQFEQSTTGVPRAPGPFGVAVKKRACSNGQCPTGMSCQAGFCMTPSPLGGVEPFADVFVTHITQADSPLASNLLPRGYLVHLSSQNAEVTESSFINLGVGATHSVTVGQRYVFASGRGLNPAGNLLRLIDPNTIDSDGGTLIYSSGIELSFRAIEARGVALSSDQQRIYLLTRAPDSLIVVSIDNPLATVPIVQVTRAVPLPPAPNALRVLPRPGRSDLLVITCATAQSLALYDDDVGDLIGQVNGVGLSPFDIAVDSKGTGARLFVSDFEDGRIAVIDIADLNRPQEARLVAHMGAQQLCLTQGQRNPQLCDAGTPMVSQ